MFGSNAKKHLSVGRRIGRGLVVVAAAGAALAGACSLAIPDAGAATSALSAPGPTFGCTSSSINVAQVKLNDDVGTVRVTAEVDEWLNGKWTNVAWSPMLALACKRNSPPPETPTFITGHPAGGFSAVLPGAGIGPEDSIRTYKNDSSKVARICQLCLTAFG